MKKVVFLLAVAFPCFTAAAQQKNEVIVGNKIISKDVREISKFVKLDISGPFEVRLVTGAAGHITVEGEKNLIDLVNTDVKGEVLTIAPQQGKLFKSSKENKIIIKVPFATLHEINFKGSGSVTAKKTITDNIKITLTGSGNVELDLATTKAEAVVAGSGNITINGTTDLFSCNVSGSGGIKAQGLRSNSVTVTVDGSGNAAVYSEKAITGRIIGSGNIAYSGTPIEKDLKRTGTGEFRVY